MGIGTAIFQAHPDPAHSESSAYYKTWLLFGITVDVPANGGGVTEFTVNDGQYLSLVRGDAAALGSNQASGANHWYLRRWDETSNPPPKVTGFKTEPAVDTFWGTVKNSYLK